MGEGLNKSSIIIVEGSGKLRETLKWLAGLLATDGTIYSGKNSKTVYLRIYSVEEDWLKRISTQLAKVGIESGMPTEKKGKYSRRRLVIYNPQKIVKLLVENGCESFCSPRKWQKIKEAYDYYEALPLARKTYSRPEPWKEEEIKILRQYWKLPDKELALKLPSRTLSEIAHKRNRLGLKKHVFKLRHKRRER